MALRELLGSVRRSARGRRSPSCAFSVFRVAAVASTLIVCELSPISELCVESRGLLRCQDDVGASRLLKTRRSDRNCISSRRKIGERISAARVARRGALRACPRFRKNYLRLLKDGVARIGNRSADRP